ncbi:MAG TPA: CPBP family intramembrane glutamic endopeptidase [Acidobacteriota bacterium]|nr:CPBP family intramembrane glutamic endopeptidase [Acidobacteriota bacterium]
MSLFNKISVFQEALLFIFLALLSYAIYFFIALSKRIKNKFIRKFGFEKTKIYWILFQRGVGVFLYGLIPVLVAFMSYPKKISFYGLSFVNFLDSIYWTLGISAVIIPFSILNARSPFHQKKYPQIQTEEWNLGLVFLSASSWIVYLFAYELLLRGLLFFACLRSFGLWPAVIINISIYAFFHLHKNYKEIFGSVLLGIVFCLITYKTGTIWTAFFAHTILALSSEWASLSFNPKMKIKLVGNKK